MKIYCSYCFHGSSLLFEVHPPDDFDHFTGDSQSQANFRDFCWTAWCPNPTLQLQQWQICWQCLQASLQKCRATPHFLWHQCPFPKWDCWEGHLQSPKECKEAVATCAAMMVSYHPFGSLAICSSIWYLPSQHTAGIGRQNISTWTFQLNLNRSQDEAHAYLWMPHVCIAEWTCIRRFDPALVATHTSRSQLGSQSNPHQKHQSGVEESAQGMRLTTIPKPIFDDFFEKLWGTVGLLSAFRQHGKIVRTCCSNSSTLFGISWWINESFGASLSDWDCPNFSQWINCTYSFVSWLQQRIIGSIGVWATSSFSRCFARWDLFLS